MAFWITIFWFFCVLIRQSQLEDEKSPIRHWSSSVGQAMRENDNSGGEVSSSLKWFNLVDHKFKTQLQQLKTRANSNSKGSLKDLIRMIRQNYNKEAVLEKPIVIHLDMVLLNIKNTIEKEGIIESVVALMIEWNDKRVQWNPLEFQNLTFLSLQPDKVWLPDIALTNSADHLYSISRDDRFTVRVSYDGCFKFVPAGTAKTWCKLDLLNFPFDIQKCWLEFESWSLDSTTMTFDGESQLVIDEQFESTQFQFCGCNISTYPYTYDFTGETFIRVRFSFTIKRKTTFYVVNLIFPIFIVSVIQTFSFLIPCKDTTADRIAFGTTNLLTLVVYQTILTEQLPKTSDAVTALSKYVTLLIVVSAIAIFESVIVERIQSRTLRPPPFLLMRIFKHVPILLRESPLKLTRFRKKSGERTFFARGSKETIVEELGDAFSKNDKTHRHSQHCCHSSERFRPLETALTASFCNISSETTKPSCFERFKRKKNDCSNKYYKQWLATGPADLWLELAYKLDFLTFIFCGSCICISPLLFFGYQADESFDHICV